MSAKLDVRKRRILGALVAEHLRTAEPVGSEAIAGRRGLDVSPATVRNEMLKLEEAGLLEQPHTSAGRVPSDKGYRFYVDAMLRPRTPSRQLRSRVREWYSRAGEELGELLAATSRLLSAILQHPAVVLAPESDGWRFRHITASAVNSHHLLVVVVTSTGEVHHRLLPSPAKLSGAQLRGISDLLNARLKGATASAVSRLEMDELCRQLGHLRVPPAVLQLIKDSLATEHEQDAYIDGMLYILKEPEFASIDKVSSLMAMFDRPEAVRSIIAPPDAATAVQVTIGSENAVHDVRDCTVITTGYSSAAGARGVIGIVAPRRMDYESAIPAVGHVAQRLGETVTRMMDE
ncbi:MAG: heat-inducible transcriptional repressor HrcA [Armatimonadota bacterium]|jgi:heat-inducible transcriptional repressor